MSAGLRISSSSFFKCPRVHPCECGCIHEDPLFRIAPVDSTLQRMDEADAWPYFPGLKFNPANAKRIDMRMDANTEYRKTAGLAPQECGGCGKFITDRYLLQALDLYWHEDCLKCGCCDCRLSENGSTLYTRANLVLCRRDYLRLFGTTGYCAACGKVIPAFEMVMKAKGNVYHLECFACQNCNHRFCVGDKFYLCDNKILCEYDYEERLLMASLEFPNKRASLQQQQGSNNQSPLLSPILSAESFSK